MAQKTFRTKVGVSKRWADAEWWPMYERLLKLSNGDLVMLAARLGLWEQVGNCFRLRLRNVAWAELLAAMRVPDRSALEREYRRVVRSRDLPLAA